MSAASRAIAKRDPVVDEILNRYNSSSILRAAARITADIRAAAGHNRGGRPRDTEKPRCPCGANTKHRAAYFRFKCCRAAGISISDSDMALARQSRTSKPKKPQNG